MKGLITLRFKRASADYDILVTDEKPLISLSDKTSSMDYSSLVLVTNTIVWRLYGSIVSSLFKKKSTRCAVIVLPDGEKYKNLKTVKRIYDKLLSCNSDRSSIIIGMGGGVIGDIAGFAASTYMRGVRYIQVPTTLLAQVDASIGGKTGVDHPLAKNIIGTFHQPSFVYSNINFLKTLPKRIYMAGMAEIIRYGAIKDEKLFLYIEEHRKDILNHDPATMLKLVLDSGRIKADIVQKDEKEVSGTRMLLNFGHTFGHAIEILTGYKILHGEAVGIGMIIASRLSYALNLCKNDVPVRIEHMVKGIGLPGSFKGLDIESLSKAVKYDKKSNGNEINLVLLKKIGAPVIYKMDKRILKKTLTEVRV